MPPISATSIYSMEIPVRSWSEITNGEGAGVDMIIIIIQIY
jgi:hypothetical protein